MVLRLAFPVLLLKREILENSPILAQMREFVTFRSEIHEVKKYPFFIKDN